MYVHTMNISMHTGYIWDIRIYLHITYQYLRSTYTHMYRVEVEKLTDRYIYITIGIQLSLGSTFCSGNVFFCWFNPWSVCPENGAFPVHNATSYESGWFGDTSILGNLHFPYCWKWTCRRLIDATKEHTLISMACSGTQLGGTYHISLYKPYMTVS